MTIQPDIRNAAARLPGPRTEETLRTALNALLPGMVFVQQDPEDVTSGQIWKIDDQAGRELIAERTPSNEALFDALSALLPDATDEEN